MMFLERFSVKTFLLMVKVKMNQQFLQFDDSAQLRVPELVPTTSDPGPEQVLWLLARRGRLNRNRRLVDPLGGFCSR